MSDTTENQTTGEQISTKQLILLLKIHNEENADLEDPEDFISYYSGDLEEDWYNLEELKLIQRSPMDPDGWITTNRGEILVTELKLISDKYGKQ